MCIMTLRKDMITSYYLLFNLEKLIEESIIKLMEELEIKSLIQKKSTIHIRNQLPVLSQIY